MTRLVKLPAALSFVFLIAAAPALSGRTGEAKAIVRSVIDEGISVLSQEAPEPRIRQILESVITEHFAFGRISEFVLGVHIRAVNEQEFKRFRSALHDHVVDLYASQLGQYRGERIEIADVQTDEENILVVTPVDHQGNDITLGWRLQNVDGELKIVDVIVDGISLAITKRQEIDGQISRHGFDGTVRRLADGL